MFYSNLISLRPYLAAGLSTVGIALFATPAMAQDFTKGSITVEQPWSRATPGGAKVATGYLVIRNAGDLPDRLTAVASEVADHVLPHTMAMKDGVMEMRPMANGLVVPAHGLVALKPGSDHLMFDPLKHPLKKGDAFSATLTFEKAGAIPVEFDIEGIGARAPAASSAKKG